MSRALEVVLAYAKLPPEELVQANELMSIISRDRHALCKLQEATLEEGAHIRAGMTPSDNVVHAVFGTSEKKHKGRKAEPNGPTDLYNRWIGMNPNGSCRDFKEWAMGMNPKVNPAGLQTTFYKARSKAA